jgi:enamine deaminase RidA (YjgF/YER057c/UK114 family)
VQARAYSPAVVTTGGKTLWLAGQTSLESLDGKPLAGDFEGQARDVFARLNATLGRAGAGLTDMVTMTVCITDSRHGTRFTEIRREVFGDNFPASALISVHGLAQPGMLVEVQGIAVVGGP